MYSLVKFHNGTFSVVLSKNISNQNRKYCIVKSNGTTNSAFIIEKNDEKSVLLATKRTQERQLLDSHTKKNKIKITTVLSPPAKFLPRRDKETNSVSKLSLPKKTVPQTTSEKFDKECDFLKNEKNSTLTSEPSPQAKPTSVNSNLVRSLRFESPIKEATTISKLSFPKNIVTPTKTEKFNKECNFYKNEKSSKHVEYIPKSLQENVSNSPVNFNFEKLPGKISPAKSSLPQSFNTCLTDDKYSEKVADGRYPVMSSQKFDNEYTFSNNKTCENEPDNTSPFYFKINVKKKYKTFKKIHDTTNSTSHENFYKKCMSLKSHETSERADNTNLALSKGKNYEDLNILKTSKLTEIVPDNTSPVKSLSPPTNCVSSSKVTILSDDFLTSSFENYDNFLMPPVSNGKHNSTGNTTNEIETSIYTNEEKNDVSVPSPSLLNSYTKISTHEDTTEISSINLTEMSTSEYLPNSSIEISKNQSDVNDSVGTTMETSIDIIKDPLNVSSVVVPHRSKKLKKHFCVFCKTLQCKLSRHLFLKHKSEKEVKKHCIYQKKCMERLQIIEELRRKGDFMHNTSENLNSGILIVSRQQQKNSKNNVNDYACCKRCKGFFSKYTIRIHRKKCEISKSNDRGNMTLGRRITQFVHPAANDIVKTKIFPVLSNDEVTKAIQYDELIMKYANKLTEKYSLIHQHDMIRAHMRYLGRFKLETMKQKSEIKQLKDIYKPQLYDTCVSSLRIVSKWDSTQMRFKTPAVAQSLTSLVKKCGYKQRAELIKTQSKDEQTDLEDFLLLWEEEIPSLINKKALEDQANQKRNKKVLLPSKEDIKTLFSFLRTRCLDNMNTLSSKFRDTVWVDLVQTTLVLIQVFNRRRAGEIERLTIDNYNNKEVVTDSVDKEILKDASEETIALVKKYVRISLRGKLGRTVSVLLCPLCIGAIELIIKHRYEAGINKGNDYIFARAGNDKVSKQYYRACPILRKMSEECGAKVPESLRGTNLRKHIATYTALLNTEEASVEHLANFMGHHKDIHKSIYRVPLPVTEITCISKILMAAIGEGEDGVENESENELEEISIINKNKDGQNVNNEEQHNENHDEQKNDTTNEENEIPRSNKSGKNGSLDNSSSRKKTKRSPIGTTKRVRWSEMEREAINKIFGELKELTKLPSLAECYKAIRRCTTLKNRTAEQLKTFIDNQRRYK